MQKEKIKKVSIGAAIVCSVVAVLFVSSHLSPVLVNDVVDEPEIIEELVWQVVDTWPAVGGVDPGDEVTGFIEIYLINHTAAGGAGIYMENSSHQLQDWCDTNMAGHTPYAGNDSFSVDIASETQFDIVVRGQFNKTHCWDGTKFRDDRVRINITFTCDGWLDGENAADDNATIVVTGNNTAWGCLYVNGYFNADDFAGYQIADDATLTISEISLEAKF